MKVSWLLHQISLTPAVYYDEDLTALLSLVDFTQDTEIVRKAEMIIDLLLLDMALNSFRGVFGSTHGRSYENTKKWAGSGLLPRAAQVKNVAIVIYKIEKIPALYVPIRLFFTHAWLPRDKFDEVIERGGWVFARKGNGYLALRSQRPYRWQTGEGQDQGREMIAEGKTNIWICELGPASEHGSFAIFVEKILAAALTFDGFSVTYHSPSQGQLRFGWTGDLTLNDEPIALHHNARYDNPYVQANFPSEHMRVKCGAHSLSLDWNTTTRPCDRGDG